MIFLSSRDHLEYYLRKNKIYKEDLRAGSKLKEKVGSVMQCIDHLKELRDIARDVQNEQSRDVIEEKIAELRKKFRIRRESGPI